MADANPAENQRKIKLVGKDFLKCEKSSNDNRSGGIHPVHKAYCDIRLSVRPALTERILFTRKSTMLKTLSRPPHFFPPVQSVRSPPTRRSNEAWSRPRWP